MKSKNSAGKSSEADMFLKTLYLEDHYTNIFCQGAWFKMWEKWWKKLDLVWKKKLTLGELVWFWTKQMIKLQTTWFQTKCEAKSYYRKLRNVFFYLLYIRILLNTALSDSFCAKMQKSGNTGVWGSEYIYIYIYISP